MGSDRDGRSDRDGPVADGTEWHGPVADVAFDNPIISSVPRFEGHVWSVRTDAVAIDGQNVQRDVLIHPGAVGVIVLDSDDRVYLLRQYRHPVAMALFEGPAGLLDVTGEDPLATAKRELGEEAGFSAGRWNVLVDYLSSPGGTTEALRCYLARDVSPLPGGRIHTGEAEELNLPGVWIPLDEAVDLVLTGKLSNVLTVVGILAAAVSRSMDWRNLRSPDSPWPIRDHLLATGRVHGD